MKFWALTTNRADYGLLRYLLLELESHNEVELTVVVTGAHVKSSLGNTITEVERDGFERIKILDLCIESDTSVDLCNQSSHAIAGLSELLKGNHPDALIVLGDRYEVLASSLAASLHRIPIVHIHGGDETTGALDNQFRHAISKLASLHFPVTGKSAQRLLQMGEREDTVITVGSPFIDRINSVEIKDFLEFRDAIHPDLKPPFCLLTIHPETSSFFEPESAVDHCIESLLENKGLKILATKSNTDLQGKKINTRLEYWMKREPERVILKSNLGFYWYLHAMHYCSFLIGNSSSGIMESGLLGKRSINLGARQEGRECGDLVKHASWRKAAINAAIQSVVKENNLGGDVRDSPYFVDFSPAKKMCEVLLGHSFGSEALCKSFVQRIEI